MKKLTIVVITGGLLWVFVVSSKGYLASVSSPKMLAKKVKRVLCLRALISVTFYCCSLLSLSDCIFVWFACCSVIVKAWKRRKLYKLLKGPGWWVWSCIWGGGGGGGGPSALLFDWDWCRSFVFLQTCLVWIGFHVVLLLCEISVAFIYYQRQVFTVLWLNSHFLFNSAWTFLFFFLLWNPKEENKNVSSW